MDSFDPSQISVRSAHFIAGRYVDGGGGRDGIDVRRPSAAAFYNKGSGIGKDLGRQAFEANLRFKSVLIDIGAA